MNLPIDPNAPVHLQVINDWLMGLKDPEACKEAITTLLMHIRGMLHEQKFYYTAQSNCMPANTNFWACQVQQAVLCSVGPALFPRPDHRFSGSLRDEPMTYRDTYEELMKYFHERLQAEGYIYLGHKE